MGDPSPPPATLAADAQAESSAFTLVFLSEKLVRVVPDQSFDSTQVKTSQQDAAASADVVPRSIWIG